jgi:hypothetical protein
MSMSKNAIPEGGESAVRRAVARYLVAVEKTLRAASLAEEARHKLNCVFEATAVKRRAEADHAK